MMNPDRVELGLQSTSVPENPKKSKHISSWLRVPTLAARTFLAVLAATPGIVVAADAIYNSVNPSTVYADSASGKLVGIERLEDCKWDIHMEATGFRPGIPISVITRSYGKAYNCPGGDKSINVQAAQIDAWEGVGVADSNGHIFFDIIQNRYGSFRYQVHSDTITAAYSAAFLIDVSYSRDQIPINTPRPTNTSIPTPAVAPTRSPSAPRPDISSNPAPAATTTKAATTSEVPVWLWGVGGVLFAGLAYKAYEGWKPSTKTASSGVATQAATGVGSTSRTGGIAGAVGAGPNAPSVNPNSAPSMGPAQPKNPEWIIGQKDFERRWQTVKSKLPPLQPGDTGNEPGYILDRFKAGMSVVHEVSLDDVTNAPEMNTRVRAGIEYLIPEIWPSNRIFTGFFDPGFNAGYLTPEDLAKIMYLPQSYRNLSSFTKGQKRDVMGIRRVLLHALHPDLLKSDADPKLQDQINTLLIQLNSTWPLINKLLS